LNNGFSSFASFSFLIISLVYPQVARESADVVLMDDNFTAIVNLVKWGRLVYQNIQQFVQFQLTINIVAVVFNFVSACISGVHEHEHTF
jgi:P-type E1-E2 ATPase